MIRAALLGACVILGLSGCTELESTSRVCRLMPELQSSSVALDKAFEDLAQVDSAVLQSSLVVLVDTISSMRGTAPLEIAESLTTLDRAYREVRQALANVRFDGSIAVNDDASINAIESLKRAEVLRASGALERFVEERCQRVYDAPVPPQLSGGSTLPTPIQDPESVDEYPFVVDDEDSVFASYGYLLVADSGLTIDMNTASCIGREVTELSQTVARPDDEALARFIKMALEKCVASNSPTTTTASTVPD